MRIKKAVRKNWCFWTVVLEKTLESPLDYKEIKQVSPKGNQLWISIGRTDAEAESPMLWPPEEKNWFTGKYRCWERLKPGEGDSRGWDGLMASLTQWTWVWANSGRWWRTGKPAAVHRVTELDTTEWLNNNSFFGNSLVVQWLGLHAFTAEGLGSIPCWGTKIPQAVWCSQKKKRIYVCICVYIYINTFHQHNWN